MYLQIENKEYPHLSLVLPNIVTAHLHVSILCPSVFTQVAGSSWFGGETLMYG